MQQKHKFRNIFEIQTEFLESCFGVAEGGWENAHMWDTNNSPKSVAFCKGQFVCVCVCVFVFNTTKIRSTIYKQIFPNSKNFMTKYLVSFQNLKVCKNKLISWKLTSEVTH